METLAYGTKKPETGDKGPVVFPALQENCDKLDGHTHNGTDTPKIPSSSVTVVTASVAAASWVAVAGQDGTFKQTVTLPAAFTYDNCFIQFRLSTGHQIFPSVEKASATTYTVYINDSSLTLTAVYTS